jgi:aerobic-type carbon monoxide dehydrogenase small subunit (CoxS/CutS family)
VKVAVEINGRRYEREVEPRTLLSDFVRHDCGLTGTHVGCEHGVCGACTVQLDGVPVRSCLLFAVQADGHRVTTVEGLEWGPLQDAFHRHHALQCGFCTPGFLMTVDALRGRRLSRDEIRSELAGNLCRCTGYVQIVEAVEDFLDRS